MEKSDTPKSANTDKERAVRSICMEWAVRANCGGSYDTEGRIITNHDKILDAARKFEAYIKGDSVIKTNEVKVVNVDQKGSW